MLTKLDHRLPHRLLHTRHPPIPLRWPRWHRPHLPRRCSPVALLQQEPRRLAAGKQCVTRLPHRRGRAEGGIGCRLDPKQELRRTLGNIQDLCMNGFVHSRSINYAMQTYVYCCYGDLLKDLNVAPDPERNLMPDMLTLAPLPTVLLELPVSVI